MSHAAKYINLQTRVHNHRSSAQSRSSYTSKKTAAKLNSMERIMCLVASAVLISSIQAYPLTCQNTKPNPPKNGRVECFETSSGYTCKFVCTQGYKLNGSSSAICKLTSTGAKWWNNKHPTCSPRKCHKLENITNGYMKYFTSDNGHVYSSSYNCNKGYQLRPSYNKDLHCLDDGTWNNVSKPCCAETTICYESTKADIVIAIDSSTSIGANNVKMAKDFSRDFIDSFSLHHDHTRFSIFRYNSKVDTQSQILLKDSIGKRQSLLDGLERIPNQLEEGLLTGKALNYTFDVILQPQNGDRPLVRNIVLLFTGSKSNDDVKSAAQRLKSHGLTTVYFVVLEQEAGDFGHEHLDSLTRDGTIDEIFSIEPETKLKINDLRIELERFPHSLCRVQC